MNKRTEKIWAIVPAAGIGARMRLGNGKAIPKQYLTIYDKPILAYTLEVLCAVPDFHQIIVPLHPKDTYFQQSISLSDPRIQTVIGADLRFGSVCNALAAVVAMAAPEDWVLVHDAVRPCITPAGIKALLGQICMDPIGGLWGVPVRDTLKKVDLSGQVVESVPREGLWHALTPQIFRFGLLYRALQTAQKAGIVLTDEASALEYLGYHPKMVQGSYQNIKITWPEDLVSAAHWLINRRDDASRTWI